MSWSASYVAASRARAIEHIDAAIPPANGYGLPDAMRKMIKDTIEMSGIDGGIFVETWGHVPGNIYVKVEARQVVL